MYRIEFGKYAGLTLERLFFEHPEYLAFAMTARGIDGDLRDLLFEAAKLIDPHPET